MEPHLELAKTGLNSGVVLFSSGLNSGVVLFSSSLNSGTLIILNLPLLLYGIMQSTCQDEQDDQRLLCSNNCHEGPFLPIPIMFN